MNKKINYYNVPTIDEICSNCGNKKMYNYIYYFVCVKCGFRQNILDDE